MALFQSPDLLALGWIANRERERRHGARTYFNHNLRLEATNVCEASCLFCSFARLKEGMPGSHTMSVEQILNKLPASTTKVIIAHRLNTIADADEIFFVNAGDIVPAGSMEHALDMLLHGKRAS